MAFLFSGRRQATSSSSNPSTSNETAMSTLLFDAGTHDGLEDVDDELEAAFGGPSDDEDDDRRSTQSLRRRTDNTASVTIHGSGNTPGRSRLLSSGDPDASIRDEEDRLLDPRTDEPPSPSSNMRPPLHSAGSSTPGAYDFERNPYERSPTVVRFAPSGISSPVQSLSRVGSNSSLVLPTAISRDMHGDNFQANRAARSRRRRPSGGILGALRNALPTRLQHYARIGGDSSRSVRQRDGNGNARGEDDDDLDDWDAPPPMLPGTYGGGTRNDGVFSNLMAKPSNPRLGPNGQPIDIVGGDDDLPEKEIPPAYEMAVLDAAPPYFDTTVHAPGVGGFNSGNGLDDLLIEGLPLGNIFSFFWSLLVSMSFQFVGFLLTTLLSTSHAAKNGSRAGLGITLIQYGLFLQSHEDDNVSNDLIIGGDSSPQAAKSSWNTFWGGDQVSPPAAQPAAVPSRSPAATTDLFGNNMPSLTNGTATMPMLLDGSATISGVANSWLAMALMIIGWFLLVSSTVQYIKAIRYAKAMRDGTSTTDGSYGGLFGFLSRIGGRDTPPEERVWGLAPRRAPPQTVSTGDTATALPFHTPFQVHSPPSIPPDSSRPTSGWPGTVGVPSAGSFGFAARMA